MSSQCNLVPGLVTIIVLTVVLVAIRLVTQNYRAFGNHEVPIILAFVFFLVMLSLGLKGLSRATS